jgi:hypothetical protein
MTQIGVGVEFCRHLGTAAARSYERATANFQSPPYLAFALAAAAAVDEGSAKAITASPDGV